MSKQKKVNYIPIEKFLEKTKALEEKKIFKTRMCKYGNNCRRLKECTFAHSQNELYIPKCKFGSRCKNKNCTFKHEKEFNWNAEPKKPKENNIENLSKSHFPNSMKIKVSNLMDTINYKEMKNIIEKVSSVTIRNNSVDQMIEDYECIKEYEEIIFNFIN